MSEQFEVWVKVDDAGIIVGAAEDDGTDEG